MRRIIEAILYVLRFGCLLAATARIFSAMGNRLWLVLRTARSRVAGCLSYHLVQRDRACLCHEPCPSVAVIDSQSLKTTEAGGLKGYKAGKKVMRRKRHAMVDTDCRALELLVHPTDLEDQDSAVPLLRRSGRRHPLVERAFPDSAYTNACKSQMPPPTPFGIVRELADLIGFEVHRRRWVVVRTFAWMNLHRRLAKDFKRPICSATALLYAAERSVLIRHLARYASDAKWLLDRQTAHLIGRHTAV